MIMIKDQLQIIQNRIHQACQKSGRDPDEVKLLLASKTVEPARIIKAFEAGYTLIGENRIQEVIEKYEALKPYPHETHYIGHLQTNKVKYLMANEVTCLHSLDRLRLAKRLQNRLEFEDKTLDVLIQVNTSREESKFGVDPKKAVAFAKEVAQFDRLNIKGLMTIGLFSADEEKARPCFKLLKELSEEIASLNLEGVEMKELSMGMSGDLEIAIEEGATIIRVGTAVFGARQYPDSYYWPDKKKPK